MRANTRELTVFGTAISDWFLSLTLMALTFTYVFGYLFYVGLSVKAGHPIVPESDTVRVINRLLIVWSGTIVLGIGVAVAYEMKKAGEDLSVHVESEILAPPILLRKDKSRD